MKSILKIALSFIVVASLAFGSKATIYNSSNGMSNDNVSGVAVDSKDQAWFATKGGVLMFDGTNWTTYTTTSDTGLINNSLNCISVGSNDDVWVGSNFGISYYNGTKWVKFDEDDGLGDNRVNAVVEGPNNKIWIAHNSGLSIKDGNSWTSYGMADGLPFGGVKDIDFDSKGDAWLATALGGIVHYDGSTFTTYNSSDGLLSNIVNSIIIDDNDVKYMGTANGAAMLDADNSTFASETRMYRLPEPDTLNPVVDIALADQGRVYYGIYIDYLVTEGGVAYFEVDAWANIKGDDLPGPVVRGLAVDSKNNLWVATSTGAAKLDAIPVGINSVSLPQTKVYPIPSNGNLKIDLEEFYDQVTVKVKDIAGQTVQSIFAENTSQISSNLDLTSGYYYLQVSSHNKAISSRRIIILQD